MHLSLLLFVTALAAFARCSIPCPFPCPSNQYCSPEGQGCVSALYPPTPMNDNCTSSPWGSWSLSGTSTAATSLANGTLPLTTASGNVSTSAIKSTSLVSNLTTSARTVTITPSNVNANTTYAYTATNPATTSTVQPATTGAANANTVTCMLLVAVQGMVAMLWHFGGV